MVGEAPRRGACPGLTAPMQTGDGLLIRLTPSGATMTLDAITALSAAARRHGNAIIEVTARGNIQVRGLSGASAAAFARDVAALGIAAPDGVPVLADPLAGLAQASGPDTIALAAALRERLAARRSSSPPSPKLSVMIDGGSELHLDAVPADIRLVSVGREGFHMGLAGDAARAAPLGRVAADDAIEAVVRLIDTIARQGPTVRAADMLRAGDLETLRGAVAGLVTPAAAPPIRPKSDPIGSHPLRDGAALGIGLAFGHTDAATLDLLIDACAHAGVIGLRTTPGRALLLVIAGHSPRRRASRPLAPAIPHLAKKMDPRVRPADDLQKLVAACQQLGFITRHDDSRRRVLACAGAPICASAHFASRALAPVIATLVAPEVDGLIHLSGCAKGCAHPGPAALTVVGTARGCDVVVNGTARDRPAGGIAAHDLPDALAAFISHAKGPSHA
jgi:precorrin-3B synthase